MRVANVGKQMETYTSVVLVGKYQTRMLRKLEESWAEHGGVWGP
jgi:hypothetical protein